MAFRAMNNWRMMMNHTARNRSMVTSTTPMMKPYAPTLDDNLHHTKPRTVKGEYISVYAAMGALLVAFSFGSVTVKQQLAYSPNVHISKKRRETLPEFSDPDYVVDETDKLVKRSFCRKVAHLQESNPPIPNPIIGDVYARPVKAETLKSVGVNPSYRL